MIKLSVRPVDGPVQVFIVQKQIAIVGRGSHCDIILSEAGISREHMKIEASRTGVCYITDLGSTNGVLLDNKRIKPNTPIPFAPFHSLSIGSIPSLSIETGVSAEKTLAAYRNILRKEDKTLEIQEIKLDVPEPQLRSRNIPNPNTLKRQDTTKDFEESSPRRSIKPILLAIVGLAAVTYFFFMK